MIYMQEWLEMHDIHAGMARDPVGRLKAMINKHHIRVSPKGRKHVPHKATRNFKKKNCRNFNVPCVVTFILNSVIFYVVYRK